MMGKITESLIADRLTKWLKTTNYVSVRQHGFFAGCSNVGLGKLCEQVGASVCLLPFLWHFRRVWQCKVSATNPESQESCCPNGLLRLMIKYLTDRKVTLKWEGAYVEKFHTKGYSQGSILGPLLWNVMFETLLRTDLWHGNRIIAYADDPVVLIQGGSRVELENNTDMVIQRISRWSSQSKMTFCSLRRCCWY